jgi:two-component system, OmpR family, response regulator MprA
MLSPAGTRRARVLIVDDDPGVAGAVARALELEGHRTEIATDGESALHRDDTLFDAVVLDVLLPGIDGLEVCRRLRMTNPDLPILMLTAKDTSTDQIAGLDAGADDYLVKPFTVDVLAARVRALLRRRDGRQHDVLRYADLALDTAGRTARRGDREFSLTTTEYKLLLQFMLEPETVLARDLLASRVWGYDFEGNFNVLEVYVRYLRQKLEAAGEERLIYTMRGSGYVLRQAEG